MMEFSPMIRQYLNIKKAHGDDLVFFRLGDFYELFFEDAIVASEILGLVLTSRDSGKGKIPMCGLPHHAATGYIEKLVKSGFRVALCEQTDEKSDGLTVRRVVRTFTVAAVFHENFSKYIMAICAVNSGFEIAYCDISTGDFFTASFDNFEALADEVVKIAPAELIVNSHFSDKFNIDMAFYPYEFSVAADGLVSYLTHIGLEDLSHIKPPKQYSSQNFMYLDKYVRRSLELFETQIERETDGSLLAVMDKTKTAMGKRLLRKWLEQPLLSLSEISTRQDAVAELKKNQEFRKHARNHLSQIGDLERFCGKIVYRKASGRDIIWLANSLAALHALLGASQVLQSSLNSYFANETDSLLDILECVSGVILENATGDINEGGIFACGYDAHLDAARKLLDELEDKLDEYAQSQRKATGIKTLRISNNRVHGYFIEVPNSAKDKVPADYLPRQGLVGSQRYSSEELKQLESQILTTQNDINDIEFDLFVKLRSNIVAQISRIQATAHAVAHFDALQSLAEIADLHNYVRPKMSEDGCLEIVDGRHPVVEQNVPDFVANDLELNDSDYKVALITGPNMAGKSTFMRQTALIAIMAQIGSFVPVKSAILPVFDAVFSRVGSADDLARGQSTFMVEMTELAHILHLATAKSLILLDEVGRGTGTTDGLSIAMATIEHIAEKIGAKTIFATHYHELTIAEGWINGLVNLSMDVEKNADGIKFLHKIVYGGTNKSYGIFVAEMAGLPDELVKRSGEIHQKVMLQGYFDENVLEEPKVVDYRAVRERAKRCRLFLEEYRHIIGDDYD